MADKRIIGSLEVTGNITENDLPVATEQYVDNKPDVVETTWADLKTLRDNSQLIPGRSYRITDYITTTTQSDTQSAGHPFDVIVEATSSNALSEDAKACQHAGDTYFTGSKLDAWQIWYCFDNDTSRFAWADITNGKGVIYRMIDEFCNDIPYDFKNILFIKTINNVTKTLYTFSRTYSSEILDGSKTGGNTTCSSNVMEKTVSGSSPYPQLLNKNVFYSTSSSRNWRNNVIGINSSSNIFGEVCYDNTIARGFSNNTIATNFYRNEIGENFTNIVVAKNCYDNSIGSGCKNNTIGESFINNIIASGFEENEIGANFKSNYVKENFRHNTIGASCANNMFSSEFYDNAVGANFNRNTISSLVEHNIFGGHFEGNTVGYFFQYVDVGQSDPSNIGDIYVRDCVFGDNYEYVNMSFAGTASGGSWMQNIYLPDELHGANQSSKLVVDITADRNSTSIIRYGFDFAGNLIIPEPIINIRWAQLKEFKDTGKLIPGCTYRMTDYICTTGAANTQSAGHQFDLLITANSHNELSEAVGVCQHEGDTYFASSNLSAWKVQYCIDNDATRFSWADTSTTSVVSAIVAGGYSYPRTPDKDAELTATYPYAWYDGYEVLYTDTESPVASSKAHISPSSSSGYTIESVETADAPNGRGVIYHMIDEFGNDVPYDFKNILFTDSTEAPKYINAYTFSYTENNETKDASLSGLTKSCYDNVIRKYISLKKQQLNFNVFYSTTTSFGCNANTFSYGCSFNMFGNNCYSNTLHNGCLHNIFGNGCSNNVFGDYFQSSIFGNGCSDNIFGNSCSYITFGDRCSYNMFGYGCNHNTFGNDCLSIIFGNYCQYIKCGDSSSVVDYYTAIVLDDSCQYLYINGNGTASSSNWLQNIHIHLGVTGTSSEYKTITVPRNLSYETNIVPAGTTTIEI